MIPASKPSPQEILVKLLSGADDIARVYRVSSVEALFHILSLASGLIGHLVRFSTPQKDVKNARFSATFISEDSDLPEWANRSWQAAQAFEKNLKSLMSKSVPRAIFRARMRAMHALDPHIELESHIFHHMFSTPPVRVPLGRIESMPNAEFRDLDSSGRPVMLLATGRDELRRAIRAVAKCPAPTLLGWLNSGDLLRLSPTVVHNLPSSLGTMLAATPTDPRPVFNGALDPVILIHCCISSGNIGVGGILFEPNPLAEETLMEGYNVIHQLASTLPGPLREKAGPDPLMPWRFASLLAAISELPPAYTSCAAKVALELSRSIAEGHVKVVRRHFPADEEGVFEGTDFHVFHRLGQEPSTVRQLQRSMRSVNKERILQALNRAVRAGLAGETHGGFHLLPEIAGSVSETPSENPSNPV